TGVQTCALPICVECEVKAQQPLPQPAAADLQCLERKVEGLTGHLPEVRVAALQRPQPRILELLLTPERAQGARLLAQLSAAGPRRSEEHTSELQSLRHLVCRLLLEKKNRQS